MNKQIVISLGGSLVFPSNKEEPDIKFVSEFAEFVKKEMLKVYDRIFIVVGGGKPARIYQQSLKKALPHISDRELDIVGIYATYVNAFFVKAFFSDYEFIYEDIIKGKDYRNLPELTNEKIIVGAGGEPGYSTDLDSVLLCERYGCKELLNLSNTKGVYDKDPNRFSDARFYPKISWEEYLGIIPNEWKPGLSTPFDPKASKLAQKLRIKVYIVKGDLINLEKITKEENFEGTIIS
ncbi:Uridylate kinase [bacterium HR34]|nr:Uridylate kinase [bacterium HR34]